MNLRRDTRGLTAPEFAVSIGVVLVVVLAIIDLGRLFAAQHALDYGVEKAARYAVVNSAGATATTVASRFTTAVTPALGAAAAARCTVSVTYPAGNAPGGNVVISVRYAWKPATTLDFLPGMTLTAGQTLTIQH